MNVLVLQTRNGVNKDIDLGDIRYNICKINLLELNQLKLYRYLFTLEREFDYVKFVEVY